MAPGASALSLPENSRDRLELEWPGPSQWGLSGVSTASPTSQDSQFQESDALATEPRGQELYVRGTPSYQDSCLLF